jgi:hypothetical protein
MSADGSEALLVDDAGPLLLELGLGDPHCLEGGERAEDGPADPGQELPLGRAHHVDLGGRGDEGLQLLGGAFRGAWEHGGAAAEDDVGVEVLPDVQVALHYRLVDHLVEGRHLEPVLLRVEQGLTAAETLTAQSNQLAVRQLVGAVVAVGLLEVCIGRA